MLFITAILIVSSTTILNQASARLNSEVDDDECRIILIKYSGIDNYIYAQGNCELLYEMCTEDYCTVKKLENKDLNFGKHDNIGLLYEGN